MCAGRKTGNVCLLTSNTLHIRHNIYVCEREATASLTQSSCWIAHSKHRQNTHNLQISSKYVEVFNHYYQKKIISFSSFAFRYRLTFLCLCKYPVDS